MPVLGRSYPATPNFVIQRRVVVQPPIVAARSNQAFIIRSAYSPLLRNRAVFSPPFTATTTTVSGTADLSQTRTNLATNPSGETNTTGWVYTAQSSGASARVYQSGVNPLYGNYVIRYEVTTAANGATPTANNGGQVNLPGVAAAGDTITASVWVRPSITQTFKLGMDWSGASASATNVAVSCPAGVWTQISASGTAPNLTTGVLLNLWTNTGTAWSLGDTFDFDGLLVEKSSTVGSYFDTTTSIITNTATAAVSGGPIPPPGPPNRSWLYPPLIRRSATTTVPVPAASTSSSGTTSLTVTPTVLSAATVTVSGSSTLTVTPAVAAAGSITVSGSTSLAVTPAVTSAANATASGSTSLTVTPSVLSAGSITVVGATVLTVTPSVLSAGSAATSGATTLTVTPAVAADGAVVYAVPIASPANRSWMYGLRVPRAVITTPVTSSTLATTSLVVTPATTAVGTITVVGATSLTVTPLVPSVGSTLGSGSTSLVVTPSVTSVGSTLGSGTTSLVVTPSVTSAGSLTVSGTSSLVVTPSVTCAGSVTVVGSTSLAVTPSVPSVGSSTSTVSGSSTTVLTPSVSATGTITVTGTATTIITPTTGAGYSLTVRASATLIITPAVSAANVQPTSASTSLSVAITVTSNGQLVTKYLVTLSNQEPDQRLWYHNVGYSMWRKNGTWVVGHTPSDYELEGVDVLLRGGYQNYVDSSIAQSLIAQGYGSVLTPA